MSCGTAEAVPFRFVPRVSCGVVRGKQIPPLRCGMTNKSNIGALRCAQDDKQKRDGRFAARVNACPSDPYPIANLL